MTRDPNRPPTHPGAILGEDVLPALGIPASTAATQLGATRHQLHRVLVETSAISPQRAVKMQNAFDLWHAERSVDVSTIPKQRASNV